MRVITEAELQTLFDEKGLHFAPYGIKLAIAVEELVLRKVASMQAEAPQATKDWRQRRADEIEILVAQNKMSAMACFTQMRQLIANPPATKDAEDDPPLLGRWHHGEGVLVSGTIRIARWDCDTNPPAAFRDKVLDWVCAVLNARLAARKSQGEAP